MKTETHKVTFKGLSEEDGKIRFHDLIQFYLSFSKVAKGALLSYVTGSSKKRGKQSIWLEKSMDFKLSGVQSGSTVIDVEAPVLHETLEEIQTQLFHEKELKDATKSTAIALGIYAIEQALEDNSHSYILDKHLLREMEHLQKFFKNKELSVNFKGINKGGLTLKKEDFDKIRTIEKKTPEPFKTKLTGKLDVLKHTQSLLELVVQDKRIKCIPPDRDVENLIPYFGKNVILTGVVNFNPSREITSFEIQSVKEAGAEDSYFNKLPTPKVELFSLQETVLEKNYRKTNLDEVIGKWPGKESIDELLDALNE